MDIADPMLKVGNAREYSRNTCIYGALIKSIEACMELTDQKKFLNDIASEVRQVKSSMESVKNELSRQNQASDDIMTALKENAESVESNHKLIFVMFFLVVVLVFTLRLN